MSRRLFAASRVVSVTCCLALSAYADTPASAPTTQPSTQPVPTASAPPPTQTPKSADFKSLLDFDELALELGFEGRFDRRAVRDDIRDRYGGRYRQTQRSYGFEETLGFRSAGTLFDERIMQFEAGARYGLTQEHFDEWRPGRDRQTAPHGDLLEYDVDLTLLPRGKISANAFAQRGDTRLPRAFQPSLDRTLERYGAGLFFNDRTLPMRFTFEHVWDELTSRTGRLLDNEQRGRDLFHYEATWQISERHALRLDYQYENRSERYSGSETRYDTARNYLTLNHTLRFGRDGRSSLETLARFQDESGSLARDAAEVSTQLRLQHTDALATNYRFQFLRDSYQELTTRTWRGEGGLTYQFFESLTSALQLYGLRQNADKNADFTEWGGLANVAFARDNAWGRFSTNLSYNHTRTDTQNGGRRGVVIGESVTLRDPLPTYLAHTDVDAMTIVVTDANRARTYLAGRDYFIIRVGRYTALRRTPTGAIADRQTVLVTYTYGAAADYDVRRHRIDLRVQQDFKFGLAPYYAASIQNEDLDEPQYLRFRARNVNRQRVGATYRQRRWSAGLEYKSNDDAIDPYEALHVNGDVVLWQDARSQLDGKGTFAQFWFDGSDGLEARDTALLDLGTSYRYLLARNLEINASAMYRYEDDTLLGITHGVDVSGALEWKLGYFDLRFEAEYDVLDLPGSSDEGLSFWIKLKRDIPLIARSGS